MLKWLLRLTCRIAPHSWRRATRDVVLWGSDEGVEFDLASLAEYECRYCGARTERPWGGQAR